MNYLYEKGSKLGVEWVSSNVPKINCFCFIELPLWKFYRLLFLTGYVLTDFDLYSKLNVFEVWSLKPAVERNNSTLNDNSIELTKLVNFILFVVQYLRELSITRLVQ